MNKKIVSLLIAVGLISGASRSFASPVNITVADNDPVATTFAPGQGGQGGEDNETEHGTTPGQVWDLEAMVVNGSTLYLVGGFNFLAGEGGYKPGDLFIKVGGTNPGFQPLSAPGTVDNSVYGYSYVVDLTQPVGATGSFATVNSLSSGSLFDSVAFDDRGANPWRYNSGGTNVANQGIGYVAGLADGDPILGFLGVGGLTGGWHNILAIDLSFLSVAAGNTVYFSYTMECGNDSLKGEYGGGFDRVPDGGASVFLISLGLGAMALVGLKRRQA